MQHKMTMGGNVSTKLVRMPGPGWKWKLKNYSRASFLIGYATSRLAKLVSYLTGIPVLTGELRAVLIRADGTQTNYGLLSCRVVTTVFVEFLVDQLQVETSLFGDFKFHDSGIGVTAENVADVDIETTDGEARDSGTQGENAPDTYRSVGGITYTSTLDITEHGLFNDITAGTLMDRSVFAPIGVVNTDSIVFSYDLQVTAGG